MFGNLKKKFSNAIQGGLALTENLQQTYLQRSGSSNSRNSSLEKDKTDDVPKEILTGGCDLLEKYEKDWKAIHKNNEANVQRADSVAEQIETIEQQMQKQKVLMTNLIFTLSGLPELSKQLKSSVKTLQQVQALTEIVEEKLERLQILCEECDVQEYMLQKQCEVSQYKQQKMVTLEVHRKKVALEHERNIKRHEENLRRIQMERQLVFDAAFRDDLEEYRQHGSIKRLETSNSTKNISLEEVTIESNETKDALEDFLNG